MVALEPLNAPLGTDVVRAVTVAGGLPLSYPTPAIALIWQDAGDLVIRAVQSLRIPDHWELRIRRADIDAPVVGAAGMLPHYARPADVEWRSGATYLAFPTWLEGERRTIVLEGDQRVLEDLGRTLAEDPTRAPRHSAAQRAGAHGQASPGIRQWFRRALQGHG